MKATEMISAEMKRRKILKGKINDVKELIKEDVFILEDINNHTTPH